MPATETMASSSSGPAHAHGSPATDTASDLYYPDDVWNPQNSPPMKPCIPKFEPSPSPPAIPDKIDPTRGDAVLIQHLDGGRRPEISQEAGIRPLEHGVSEDDCQSGCESEITMGDESEDEDGPRANARSSVPTSHYTKNAIESSVLTLAENAVAAAKAAKGTANNADELPSFLGLSACPRAGWIEISTFGEAGETGKSMRRENPMSNAKRPVLAPPVPQYQRSPEMYSPRQIASQVLMAPNSSRSPTSLVSGSRGDLAPFRVPSPTHDSVLPPIRSLYESFPTSPKGLALRTAPPFPSSPSVGPSRLGAVPASHNSPPISPDDRYRNSIPSPANTVSALSPFSTMSMSSSHPSPSGLEYGGNGVKSERSSIVQTATPPTDVIANTMSINNVTNPPVGQFTCKFKGCNAQPFQTQYLLNSHANVHSTARPHYCAVKGCPRGEGGQGFKRKNEMIRHGLVHDSPGYVCPFCPDREHKYPRPDNLQRHVRVHHADKDREDPALREVLAHRPDGPNRGRRRRAGP